MLFFLPGGKLKITCAPLENAVTHHAVKAEKNRLSAFTEKLSCSIVNSDTHALCTFQ